MLNSLLSFNCIDLLNRLSSRIFLFFSLHATVRGRELKAVVGLFKLVHELDFVVDYFMAFIFILFIDYSLTFVSRGLWHS